MLAPGGSHHDLTACGAICLEDMGNLCREFSERGVDKAAGVGAHEDAVVARLDNTYIVGGLDGVGHRVAHLDDALWNLAEAVHQDTERLALDDSWLAFAGLDLTEHVGIGFSVIEFQPVLGDNLLLDNETGITTFLHAQDGLGRRGDGSVGLAHPQTGDANVAQDMDELEETLHGDDGTGATFVDVDA